MNAKEYDTAATILRQAIDQVAKKIDPETKKLTSPPAVFYLMLAAVENETPPKDTAAQRARKTLEQGLAVQPQSIELVQAEYILLSSSGDPKAGLAILESKTQNDPKGTFRRLLVDVLREQRIYGKAEENLRNLDQGVARRHEPGRGAGAGAVAGGRRPAAPRGIQAASNRSTIMHCR